VKHPFKPAPPGDGIRGLRIHELVRDHPELLPILEELGMLPEMGGDALPEDLLTRSDLGERLQRALAWRGS